jgi:hypothetical protein
MTATPDNLAARAVRNAALAELDFHWGQGYDIAVTRDGWVAKRLDNDRSLVAATSAELHALIWADYTGEPWHPGLRPAPIKQAALIGVHPLLPLSVHVQAAALRAAFPHYRVGVLARRDDRPRFEAISRDGRSPCCLISADASEIWRELKTAANTPCGKLDPT